MNRWLMVAAVAAVVGVTGCAEGVEDPLPTPTAPEPQKPAPTQALGGQVDSDPVETPVPKLFLEKVPVPGVDPAPHRP